MSPEERHAQRRAEEAERDIRSGRCPDGGYCHGRTFVAGSETCEPGLCFRVKTSGPPVDRGVPG